MLLFIDSFDHYGSADIGLKWSATANGVGSVTIDPTGGRRGGGALKLTYDATVRKDIPGKQTVIIGMAAKFNLFPASSGLNSNIQFLTLGGGAAPHLYFAVWPDGALAVYYRAGPLIQDATLLGNTTGDVVHPAVYAYIEVKATISATVGAVKILVNGQTVLNLTNVNTLGFENTAEQVTRFTLANPNNTDAANLTLYDDFYLADNTGTINNDFFGDVRVDLALPNADGTYTDFTPDTGTVHYVKVNELVADSLTNVASSTVGAKDSYQFTDLTGIVGIVRGVQIVDAATKDDAGVRSIGHIVKSGVSEVYSAAMPLSTDRKLYTTMHETNPATGTNWTQASINAAEFGVYVAE